MSLSYFNYVFNQEYNKENRMNITDYIKIKTEKATALITQLVSIPSPTFEEKEKAEFCLEWFRTHGMRSAFIDEAGSVIYELGDENLPTVLIMAHTDTVFSRDTEYIIRDEDGRLYCPGISDDTANLALMMLAAAYFSGIGAPSGYRLVFAANTCEEGLGNLEGCRRIVERYKNSLCEVVALDLYMDTIKDECVGSERYKITVDTLGGHSFGDFGRDNAIKIMADIINELSKIELPKEYITTYNFGTVSGGTTVNSIASHAELLYEYRSTIRENLEYMRGKFQDVINSFSDRYTVTAEVIGLRPCACGVNEIRLSSLIKRAENAYDGLLMPGRAPLATDCNLPLSMGIPSVCIGLVRGGGAHTVNEYIEKDSIEDGFGIIMKFVNSYYTEK